MSAGKNIVKAGAKYVAKKTASTVAKKATAKAATQAVQNATAKAVAKGVKPSLSATKKAVKEAQKKVGKIPKTGSTPGKFGSPQRGTAKKGYRLDPPSPKAPRSSPESYWHVNWWDYTLGKMKSGLGQKGAIPIK
ncbi:MAG: hypothetical protein M1536_03845 [Firmicutes bacterium]|nr:hypothetical protein [Bacillota bacterium]